MVAAGNISTVLLLPGNRTWSAKRKIQKLMSRLFRTVDVTAGEKTTAVYIGYGPLPTIMGVNLIYDWRAPFHRCSRLRTRFRQTIQPHPARLKDRSSSSGNYRISNGEGSWIEPPSISRMTSAKGMSRRRRQMKIYRHHSTDQNA